MKTRKILISIGLLFLFSLSISTICASDNVDLNLSVENNTDTINEIDSLNNASYLTIGQQDLSSNNDYDVYFNASNSKEGNGSRENPYKNINTDINGRKAFFANGEYSLSVSGVTLNTSIVGESSLGVIINGNNNYLNVKNSGILSLNNLTIKNTRIKVYNKLNCYGVNFIDCKNYNGYGSSIYGIKLNSNPAPSINLNYCNFYNSFASFGGSIYLANGSLNINNTRFVNSSSANYGGIISAVNSILSVNNSLFNCGLSLNDLGGGIYGVNSNLTINHSNFTNCNSTFGTISVLEGTLNLYDSLFENNTAEFEGGAVFARYSPINIVNSRFNKNTAINGGALYVDNGTTCIIKDSLFQDNTASNIGGAIFSNENPVFIDSNNRFVNNMANNYSNIYNQSHWPMYYGGLNTTIITNRNITFSGNLPSKYNLADWGYVTSVKNQKTGGNCWAFATLAALESAILKANNQTYDFSEENMKNLESFFSQYGLMYFSGSTKLLPNDGGNYDMGLGYLVSWMGPVLEELDQYNENNYVSYLYQDSTILHVQNIYFVPPRQSYTDNDNIKKALIEYGAVCVSMNYNNTYLNGDSYYDYSGETALNHAVSIVGWDDNYSKSNFKVTPPGDGAFIIKNSWGSSNGDNGFFYVSYYDTNLCRLGTSDGYAFILNDSNRYNKNYQYDTGGISDYLVTGKNNIWYRNTYSAIDDDYIAAFSTYFKANISNYTAYIYVNDNLVHTVSGSMPMGYYTILLNKNISIKKGDNFTVAIKLSTSNEYADIPIEEASTYRLHLIPGLSYFSYDGKNWIDLYDYEADMSEYGHWYHGGQVASIKVFTINEFDLKPTTTSIFNFTNISLNIPGNLTVKVIDWNGNTVNSGNLTYYIYFDDKLIKIQTVNVNSMGLARYNYKFDKIGNYTVKVIYSSDGYTGNENITSLKVSKLPSNIWLEIHNIKNTSNFYLNINLNSSVSNGLLKIYINNEEFKANMVNGRLIVNLTNLESGEYKIKLMYMGDDFYQESVYSTDLFIKKYKRVNTRISSSDFYQKSVDFNSGERGNFFIVRLLDSKNSPLKNKLIKIGFNGVVYNRTTDSEGRASLQINLKSPGTYTFATTFLSDDNYEGSFIVNKIIISKKPSKLTLLSTDTAKVNVTKTLIFKLEGRKSTDNNKYINAVNKKIKITVNNRIYYLNTDINGQAVLKLKFSKTGVYTIVTSFAGDDAYSSNVISSKITVKK